MCGTNCVFDSLPEQNFARTEEIYVYVNARKSVYARQTAIYLHISWFTHA
jgi:hypothetical protein